MHKCTWKDIVEINGAIAAEEFPISGEMDGDSVRIDEFITAVAEKYCVSADEVKTYMMDDIDFDPSKVPFGAEECGCYFDGVAEWMQEVNV